MSLNPQIIIAALFTALLLFIFSLLPSGIRRISAVENIDGLPFPAADESTVITEKLAHLDVYLQEPAIGKQLMLTIRFAPGNATRLAIGVRQDSFWLSYDPVVFFASATPQSDGNAIRTTAVTIPLTDKFQNVDRSLDIMFFATNPTSVSGEREGVADQTDWQLHSLTADVSHAWPTYAELKDYIRSVKERERAI